MRTALRQLAEILGILWRDGPDLFCAWIVRLTDELERFADRLEEP